MTNYINEFISVVDYFLSKENTIKKIQKSKHYLFVENEEISKILEKYEYDTVINKMRIWRSLNWIDSDEGMFTKRMVVGDDKQRKRYVKIDIEVYKTLKKHTKST